MKEANRLGIWMDHSSAHLMEFTTEIKTIIIESEFNHQVEEQSLSKSESLMHNKEQHKQAEFYKKLGEIIRNYDEVLLFGPTNAKEELYNILKIDPLFFSIKFVVSQGDKMTVNQKHAFVREHFAPHKFHPHAL